MTYPLEIQPLWAKLADLPEDAEDALEFWTNDGSLDNCVTDYGPRGKWNRLMSARLVKFQLPVDWEQTAIKLEKKRRSPNRQNQTKIQSLLDDTQIVAARKNQGWSQRDLAVKTGKSQSWIRDLEKGRFSAKAKDQSLLRQVLGISSS